METKRFYLTSEFWLTMAVNVATVLMSLSGVLPSRYSAMALALANGLYAIGRGAAKSGVKPTPEL